MIISNILKKVKDLENFNARAARIPPALFSLRTRFPRYAFRRRAVVRQTSSAAAPPDCPAALEKVRAPSCIFRAAVI